MAYEVELEDGTVFEFENEPTAAHIQAAHAQWKSQQQPQKPNPSILDQVADVGRGIPLGITGGINIATRGVGHLIGQGIGVFDQAAGDRFRQKTDEFVNQQEQRRRYDFGQTSTTAGEIAEGVSQGGTILASAAVPGAILPTVAGHTMGAATDVMDKLEEKGVSLESFLGRDDLKLKTRY